MTTLQITLPPELAARLDERIASGFAGFGGVKRRFTKVGEVDGITIIDDYGHHPAEIAATLTAARGCNYGRILALFQPHRYTRTQHLWKEFCQAFNNADLLVLTDIYAASENPIAGVTGEALAQAIRDAGHKNVVFRPSMQQCIDYLLREARPGDAVFTIGAGSVSKASDELASLLGAEDAIRNRGEVRK